MSPVTCPQGHQSNDPEWCDVCGARLGAPAAAATAPDPPAPDPEPAASPAAGGLACPNCGESNPPASLFCEGCGYDFTTGQAPPAPASTAAPVLPEPAAEPVESAVKWVAIVTVDPDWYALKGALAEAPCPPATSSTVPLAGHTALIGRTSQSRGLRPEIALDGDTGVSRRHAQFVRDGDNISVVDLSSTNGTYVVYEGEQPAEDTPAITPSVAVAIDDGDSVYVGAWTRLTVRKA